MRGQFDGNLAALDAHERRNEEWLNSLYTCERCGEKIQSDHYYEWGGNTYCAECMFDVLKEMSVTDLAEWASMFVEEDEIKFFLIEIIMPDLKHIYY